MGEGERGLACWLCLCLCLRDVFGRLAGFGYVGASSSFVPRGPLAVSGDFLWPHCGTAGIERGKAWSAPSTIPLEP